MTLGRRWRAPVTGWSPDTLYMYMQPPFGVQCLVSNFQVRHLTLRKKQSELGVTDTQVPILGLIYTLTHVCALSGPSIPPAVWNVYDYDIVLNYT